MRGAKSGPALLEIHYRAGQIGGAGPALARGLPETRASQWLALVSGGVHRLLSGKRLRAKSRERRACGALVSRSADWGPLASRQLRAGMRAKLSRSQTRTSTTRRPASPHSKPHSRSHSNSNSNSDPNHRPRGQKTRRKGARRCSRVSPGPMSPRAAASATAGGLGGLGLASSVAWGWLASSLA